MKKELPYGQCKLCGQNKPLTFEHVPPNKAFNFQSIKKFSRDDSIELMAGSNRLPWDFEGLHGKINQKGYGDFYLCEDCNNNTGSWYMDDYVKLTRTFCEIIVKESLKANNRCSFQLIDFYPLRIYKALLTMFCDINHNCFGDSGLRDYLLNKESTFKPNKNYSIHIYMVAPGMMRITSFAGMLIGNTSIGLSEIAMFPFGATLYIDKPNNIELPGLCIDDFANYGYDEKCNADLIGLPYYEINSHFPIDFRTKKEIESCVEENKEWSENNG